MASSFEVIGGRKLKGEITPQGAKNEALQVISAVLLTDEEVTITNIPDILDVNNLIDLLAAMNVKVNRTDRHSCTFQADDVDLNILRSPEFKNKSGTLRGSVMLAGPMLGRYKKAFIPKPGGDKIGRRRLDTHLLGFQKLGAEMMYYAEEAFYHFSTDELKGTYILLDEPSVTGTANVIMAAVLAKGTTATYNAACEPYVQQLCKMLNKMGASINGVGSNLLVIDGVEKLGGTQHRILPDMIEIGSLLAWQL